MRAKLLLFFVLGAVVVVCMGQTWVGGTIDSRNSGQASLNPTAGDICLDDNQIQFDSTCSQEYIVGDSGYLDFYSGGQSIAAFTSTAAFFRKFINVEAARISLNSGQYGQIRSTVTEGTHLCTNDNAFQTNNWAFVPEASCGNVYNFPTMSNPTLWWTSNAGSGSPLERAYATHDGSSFIIKSHTGPISLNNSIAANAKTLTSSDTLDSNHQIVYIDATSNDVTATLPSAGGCLGGTDGGGPMYRVKRLDGSGFSATVASGDNIDGAASVSLTQYASLLIHCYNGTYHVH